MIRHIISIIRNPDSPLWGPLFIYDEWAYPVHCVIEFLGSNWFLFPVVGFVTYLVYRKHSRREQFQAFVVSYYFLIVAIITGLIITSTYYSAFKDWDTGTYSEMTRISIGTHMSLYNLKFFASIAGTFRRNILYGMVQSLGNIILFIPCGIFIQQFSKKRNAFLSVFYCFLVSLLIETCQLFLPSSFDVDDLFLNTLGGAIGVLTLHIAALRRQIVRIQQQIQAKIKWLH